MPKTLEKPAVPPVINDEYERVAVSELKLHPRNARQGDLGAIIENIRANGFYGAVIAQRSTRHVIIGNHRLRAAVELGIPSVPVIWLECDNDQALRLMLSDNQTSDIASNDPNALAELLAELAQTDKGLSGTGFDGDDLQVLLDDLAGVHSIDFDSLTIPNVNPGDETGKLVFDFTPEQSETVCATLRERTGETQKETALLTVLGLG